MSVLFFSVSLFLLFASSLTHSFFFIFSGFVTGIYRRDYSKVSDQPASQFGSKGAGDGQFDVPYSVACNSRGEIIVADYDNHRIQVFDRNGKFLFKFGSYAEGNGQFDRPQGVSVDQRNNQIMVPDENHRIQIFDEKGTFLQVFGSKGNGDGQLSYPRGVVVDQQGNYVVTDTLNHRIQIFVPRWCLHGSRGKNYCQRRLWCQQTLNLLGYLRFKL